MSLLQNETVNLLGIGSGGIQDYAFGIRERKKANREYIHKRTISNIDDARMRYAAASGGGDEGGGTDSGDRMKSDPKKTDAQRFQLNTNDKAFIEGVQKLSKELAGMREPGRNKSPWINKFNDLATLASKSSKGDLGKYFTDFADYFNRRGRHIGAHEVAPINDDWLSMLADVNKKLDTSIDTSAFEFSAAPQAQKAPVASPAGKVLSTARDALAVRKKGNVSALRLMFGIRPGG